MVDWVRTNYMFEWEIYAVNNHNLYGDYIYLVSESK